MILKRVTIACVVVAVAVVFLCFRNVSAMALMVKVRYPAVNSTSIGEFVSAQDTVIFDVRELDEYQVSHLDAAIRVAPDITPTEFLDRYGALIDVNSTIVFYCSLGRRASGLVERLRLNISPERAQKLSNLEGGIFRWHNEHRVLYRAGERTDRIHPYSAWWGQMINRKEQIDYGH